MPRVPSVRLSLGAELLGTWCVHLCNLTKKIRLPSRMAVPVRAPTSDVYGFPCPHILPTIRMTQLSVNLMGGKPQIHISLVIKNNFEYFVMSVNF